jgi:hypothetical protein
MSTILPTICTDCGLPLEEGQWSVIYGENEDGTYFVGGICKPCIRQANQLGNVEWKSDDRKS